MPPATKKPHSTIDLVRDVAPFLAVVAVFALQSTGFHDLRHDDAYISYRYGLNLATGHGMVFNPGERILGTTAPGHALLAAALVPVVGTTLLPSAMSILGCLGWTLHALAAFVLLRRALGTPTAALLATALAVGVSRGHDWVALETNLVHAAVLGTVVLALADRWRSAAVLCAVAGLLRPDAYLIGALLAPLGLLHLRLRSWQPAALFGVVALPWLLFADLYYGSPRPLPSFTKYQQTSLGTYAEHLVSLPARSIVGSDSPLWIAVLWALAIGGTWRLVRTDRRLAIVPAYALAHALAYLVLRPATGHGWHLFPVINLVALLALTGLATLLERLTRRWQRRRVPALVLGAVVLLVTLRTVDVARGHPWGYWFGARDDAYRQAAAYLLEHGDDDELIASFEVGTLGYVTGRRLYDWSGLITLGPTFPADRPDERWYVVDDGARHLPESLGLRPVASFRRARFQIHVYDRHDPEGRRTDAPRH